MIRSSLGDQSFSLFCSSDVNLFTITPPSPILTIVSCCFEVFIPSNHMASFTPLHSLCEMEIRSFHFLRDETDKSLDGCIDGCAVEVNLVWSLSLQVSIQQRLHCRLVAAKCSSLLADTKQGSKKSFQTSPLLARDYSLGCYPIML